jgi:hypothetical protein
MAKAYAEIFQETSNLSEFTGEVVFNGVDSAVILLPSELSIVEGSGGNGEKVMILGIMVPMPRQIIMPTSIRDI